MNPHKVTATAIEDLYRRSEKRIEQLFPKGVPANVAKRKNREGIALQGTPYTHALLIVDEVIKTLRKHRFTAILDGDWFCCYYAWLLDLVEEDPMWLARDYQNLGWGVKQFYRYKCLVSPLVIRLEPGWGKSACLELLRIHADQWGFWVWESPEGNFRLISIDYRPDDMYATYAPAIRIVEGWERIKP